MNTGEKGLGGTPGYLSCVLPCGPHLFVIVEEGAAKGPALFTYFTHTCTYLLQAAPGSPKPAPVVLVQAPLAAEPYCVAGGRLGQRRGRVMGEAIWH